MDRDSLAKHGIFIADDDQGCELLPPHVEALQEALLDFRRTIPDRFGCTEDKLREALKNGAASQRDDMTEHDHAEVLDELQSCDTVTELTRHLASAGRLETGEYSEDDWKTHFEELFLDPLVEAAQVDDGDTRQTARAKFYYDSFQQARDRPWTLFESVDDQDGTRGDLPQPKPSWVAHFPVYVIFPVDHPGRHSGLWRFASTHSIVDNFSQVTLEHLASHGLEISATGVTKTGRRGAALSLEYVCFPWLIVEHMKDEYKGNVELCYSHAANAGSGALEMFQNLSRHESNKCPNDTHIPPVVVLTTRRDLVRVWIMHSAHSKDTCEMHLVWIGSLTRMVDIFELRAILENCQTWATRVLRPWISRQIDLWKQQCPDDCPRPFDASLRYRAAQRDSSNRKSPDDDAPEQESKQKDRKEVADLRQMIREEQERLLERLSEPASERKTPTRSIATQTDPDEDRPPSKPQVVPPTALRDARYFLPRKILPAKPRIPRKSDVCRPSMSRTEGRTVPVSARKEASAVTGTDDEQDRATLFTSAKRVVGKERIFTIKLPDVSSEEIVASKPWLGAKKGSEVKKKTETVLKQKSEEVKDEVEGSQAEKDKVDEIEKKEDKKGDDATQGEKDESEGNGTEEKGNDGRGKDKNDDKADKEEEGKEEEGKEEAPISLMEKTGTRSGLAMDDKVDPPKDTTKAGSIPAESDAKETLRFEPLIYSEESSAPVITDPKESAEKESSGEIIEEENSDNDSDKENSEGVMGREKSEDAVENENPKESMTNDNPTEIFEKENPRERESATGEKGGRDPGYTASKLPLLTPESKPADSFLVDPPASAKQLGQREGDDQKKDDDHKETDQPSIKRDTPPPRDELGNTLPTDTPSTPKAVIDAPSPAETKRFPVFDATRWTHAKFAFGSPDHSKEPAFTFKMKTEGAGAEDPRNSVIPGNEATAGRIFSWPKQGDEDSRPERNPQPLKLARVEREFGADITGRIIRGDREPGFVKPFGSGLGSENQNPSLTDENSQSGGDGPASNGGKENDKPPEPGRDGDSGKGSPGNEEGD